MFVGRIRQQPDGGLRVSGIEQTEPYKARIISKRVGETESYGIPFPPKNSQLRYSADGWFVTFRTQQGNLQVWDLRQSKLMIDLPFAKARHPRGFLSDDGSLLGYIDSPLGVVTPKDQKIAVYDVGTGQQLFDRTPTSVASLIHPGQNCFAIKEGQEMLIWEKGKPPDEWTRVAVSRRMSMIAAMQRDRSQVVALDSRQGQLRVWNVPDGRQQLLVGSASVTFHEASFSPDGKSIMVVGHDRSSGEPAVLIFDPQSGDLRLRLTLPTKQHKDWRGIATFSPDSRHVFTATMAGDILRW